MSVFSAIIQLRWVRLVIFFFNDTATTEIYTLSLHDALPISFLCKAPEETPAAPAALFKCFVDADRKSTRLNSSHLVISYAVFCLKQKHRDALRHTPRLYAYQIYFEDACPCMLSRLARSTPYS